MRVGLVIGSPRIGGTERQVGRLASGLVEAGHEVTVWFLERSATDLSPRIDFGPVEERCLAIRRWNRPWKCLELARQFRSAGLHVAHMFNREAIELGGFAGRIARIPKLYGSVRGLLFDNDPRVCRRLRWAVRFVHRVTVNTHVVAERLEQRRICRAGKAVYIGNGIALGSDAPPPRDRVPQVLFAGSLKPVKNPGMFLEAGKRVLAHDVACRFVVVGDGPLRAALERTVRHSDYADAFEFRGAVHPDDVPFGEADIVVSTSWREGSSNTLLESLAHGRPVIGTDVGGTGELLRCGEFGLLVQTDDSAGCAKALEVLLDDASLRERLGENGRRYIAAHHSMQLMIDRHLELYTTSRSAQN